jgi:hypothetical protein
MPVCNGVNHDLPALCCTQNNTTIFFYAEILKPFRKLGELLTLTLVKGLNRLGVYGIHGLASDG